jgi:hypothetical protein
MDDAAILTKCKKRTYSAWNLAGEITKRKKSSRATIITPNLTRNPKESFEKTENEVFERRR